MLLLRLNLAKLSRKVAVIDNERLSKLYSMRAFAGRDSHEEHQGLQSLSSQSQQVCWAAYAQTSSIQNVRADHRCPHIAVSQQLLDSSDVRARLQQMRREAVPQ